MNLDLIKQEIDSRKKEKNIIAERTGIDLPMAKDNFLHGLQQSLVSGVPNKASTKLKVVNERAENIKVTKDGILNKNTTPVNEHVLQELAQPVPQQNYYQPQPQNYQQPPQNYQRQTDPNALDPREEQFYRNLQETKQILGSSNNIGLADAMALYQKQPQEQNYISSPNALNEAVKREVNNFLSNIDIGRMVEDIVKNTMMEIYRKERVEQALNENQEMIQKMVVNTILAIKKRNAQQSGK